MKMTKKVRNEVQRALRCVEYVVPFVEKQLIPDRYCVQCTDKKSGKVGDFAFHSSRPFEALSPVFTSLADFYPWMRSAGLKHKDVWELEPE